MARGRRGDPRRAALPVAAWPAADRAAWGCATARGGLLDEAGPAAGWSGPARAKRAFAYGRWLGFLARAGGLDPASGPADRVGEADLRAYVAALGEDCAPVTVWSYVDDLAVVLAALAPEGDWGPLRRLAGRLRARMRPSVDRARLVVPVGRLYAEGLAQMAEAARPPRRPAPRPGANRRLEREVAYRDGLLLALLAACPLRRRSLALLEVGRHLVRHPDGYRLRLGPAETKNGTAYEAPLPASLAPWLDRYLGEVRPRLLGGSASARLWVSRDGTGMTVNGLSRRVEAVTGRRLGRRMGPHLFRHCAATALALEAPEEAGSIAALLGHQGPGTGERYYNLAEGSAAAAGYQGRLAALRGRLREEAAPAGPGPGLSATAPPCGRYTDARPIPGRARDRRRPEPFRLPQAAHLGRVDPGLPALVHALALAALTPSGWRPRPSAVSSSAKTAGMSGNVSPAAGPVSTGCSAALSATPSALSSRTMSRRSSTDLAGRPTRVTTSRRVARGNLTPGALTPPRTGTPRPAAPEAQGGGPPPRHRYRGRGLNRVRPPSCTFRADRPRRRAERRTAPSGRRPRAGETQLAGRGGHPLAPPPETRLVGHRLAPHVDDPPFAAPPRGRLALAIHRPPGIIARAGRRDPRRPAPLRSGASAPPARGAPALDGVDKPGGAAPAGRRRSSRRLGYARMIYSVCTVFGGRRAGFGMVDS